MIPLLFEELSNLPALLADVQAGGGGSFSGGGSSGGGASGGGDGALYVVYFLIRLAIERPLIGVPLLIVVGVGVAVSAKRGKHRVQERAIRRTRPLRRQAASRATAALLARTDPTFKEGVFLDRVERAFHTAQSAWCAQELEPLRAFVSDGVYERFSLQIEEQLAEGWRQGMSGTRVVSRAIAHVETGTRFETVTVRIDFDADIHRLDRNTGRRIPGSRLPRNQFAECWSFVRNRGARTPEGGGLIEGQCPNCGAALRMNQSAKCGTCSALVRSGEFDWVLSEITQASEWSPEREAEVPGMAAFIAGDPAMSMQLLEDRASVAFWREAAAQFRGEAEPLMRVAGPELCASYAARFESSKGDGARRYIGDRAVGSVRTHAIIAGEEQDRTIVEVVWDGRAARVDAAGERSLDSQRRLRSTLLVLARKTGEKTRSDETFTNAFCRNCGAHDAGGTDPSCPYCGAPRTGDSSNWMLHEIAAQRSADYAALMRELGAFEHPVPQPLPSATGLLAWAVGLVRADGEVDAGERRALERFAVRMDLPRERLERFLAREEVGVPRPKDSTVAASWLRGLVELALDDGHLSHAEQRFLLEATRALGLKRADLIRIEAEVRSRLYRDARDARRSARAAG